MLHEFKNNYFVFLNKNKIDENEFNKAPIKLNNLCKVYLDRKQNGLTQGLELKFTYFHPNTTILPFQINFVVCIS